MNIADDLRRNVLLDGMYEGVFLENGGILESTHGVPIYRAERSKDIAAQNLDTTELV